MGSPSQVNLDWYLKQLRSPARPSRGSIEKITESVALAIVFLVSFAANSIVCIVLPKMNRRRTVSNLLLLSLTVANLALSVLFIPFVLASVISDRWIFGPVWCDITGFLMTFMFNASNFSILSIAVYRYYLIVKPLAVKIDFSRAQRMTGFVWMMALVFALPPLFEWNMYEYSPAKAYCTIAWHTSVPGLVFTMFHACTSFLVPVVFITYIYRAIYIRAKKRKRTGYYQRRMSSNGHMRHSFSSQSLANQQLICGCFPRGVATNERDYYGRKNSEIVVSFSSSSLDSTSHSSPFRQSVPPNQHRRHLSRQTSLYSSILQQRTFQSAFAIVISLIVCTTPYYILNFQSAFRYTMPHFVIDFVTSWLYLSLTAVHPITYGHSNRHVRRAVARLPIFRALISWRLSSAHVQEDSKSRMRYNEYDNRLSIRNDTLESESTT